MPFGSESSSDTGIKERVRRLMSKSPMPFGSESSSDAEHWIDDIEVKLPVTNAFRQRVLFGLHPS